MNQRVKLRKLLEVFEPQRGTAVDFSLIDQQVAQFKAALTEKIQAQTIDDVSEQLEKFKKKFNLKPLFDSLTKLENDLDEKIKTISEQLVTETKTLKRIVASKEQDTSNQIQEVSGTITALKTELSQLTVQRTNDVKDLKDKLEKLFDFSLSAQDTFLEIQKLIEKNDKDAKKKIETFNELIEKLRQDFNTRLANVSHGGNANRNIAINSNTSILSRYTDINFKPGTNITFTALNNNTTKYLDFTIAATGGPGGMSRSIEVISASQAAGDTSGTDYVYVCSAGIALTMPTAVANTNLYTVKNVGTSSVLIATTGGETIDTQATIIMPIQFTSVDLISDGANWNIT